MYNIINWVILIVHCSYLNIDFFNVQMYITDLTILSYESYVPFVFFLIFKSLSWVKIKWGKIFLTYIIPLNISSPWTEL